MLLKPSEQMDHLNAYMRSWKSPACYVTKCTIIAEEHLVQKTWSAFLNSEMTITTVHRVLGSIFVCQSTCEMFKEKSVASYVKLSKRNLNMIKNPLEVHTMHWQKVYKTSYLFYQEQPVVLKHCSIMSSIHQKAHNMTPSVGQFERFYLTRTRIGNIEMLQLLL